MRLAMECKRLIHSPIYLSLWIKAADIFCFSKEILTNTSSLLIDITKHGKNYLPRKMAIQIILTGQSLKTGIYTPGIFGILSSFFVGYFSHFHFLKQIQEGLCSSPQEKLKSL